MILPSDPLVVPQPGFRSDPVLDSSTWTVTCWMSFWKVPHSGGEVVLKGRIECGEQDNIYIIDKCIIHKAFRGTNYKYDKY